MPLLDLDYPEDSSAEVDANVVMTGEGGLVEVQATAERTPLSRAHLDELLALAAARHRRACARSRPPRPPVSAPCRRLVLATRNAHKAREFSRACCAASSSSRCPTTSSCRPRPATRSRPTRCSRRAPPRRRPARPAIADDSGIEADGARRRARRALGALRRRGATDAENLAKLPRRGAGRLARCATSARSRYVEPGADDEHLRGQLRRARMAAAPRGERRLRLRPGVRPRRPRRRPHDGRAHRRREGRDLPPRPRGAGGGGMAGRAADARARASRSARRRALDRVELRADPAQGRGRRRHRLGRDHHRGDPLGDRPDRLDRRLLLGPQGRDARRRRAPLRPREVREPRRRRSRGC